MIYFAYGSNLDPEQMATRCPGHRVVETAKLADHQLCFPRHSPVRGCGVAGIRREAGATVWGVLYELNDRDLAILDRLEGYDPTDEAGSRYLRIMVEVTATNSRPIVACSYMAVPDNSGALPSLSYMQHILAGARHHGLPPRYIAMLEAQTLTDASAPPAAV